MLVTALLSIVVGQTTLPRYQEIAAPVGVARPGDQQMVRLFGLFHFEQGKMVAWGIDGKRWLEPRDRNNLEWLHRAYGETEKRARQSYLDGLRGVYNSFKPAFLYAVFTIPEEPLSVSTVDVSPLYGSGQIILFPDKDMPNMTALILENSKNLNLPRYTRISIKTEVVPLKPEYRVNLFSFREDLSNLPPGITAKIECRKNAKACWDYLVYLAGLSDDVKKRAMCLRADDVYMGEHPLMGVGHPVKFYGEPPQVSFATLVKPVTRTNRTFTLSLLPRSVVDFQNVPVYPVD